MNKIKHQCTDCMWIAKVNGEKFCTVIQDCKFEELGTGLEIREVYTPKNNPVNDMNKKDTDGWNISY